MPPVKVKIEKIESQRVRQHTFQKRKTGLIKKAIELTILCDCDVSIIINKRHASSNARSARLVAYSNRNIQDMIAECWDELEKCAQVTNAVYPKASSKAIEENDGKPAKEGENSDDDEGEGDDMDTQLQKAEGMAQGATSVKEEVTAPPAVSASRADINRKIALTIQRDKLAMSDVDCNSTMHRAQPAIAITEANKPLHVPSQQQVLLQGRMHGEMQQGGGSYFQGQQQKMNQQHQQHQHQHQHQQMQVQQMQQAQGQGKTHMQQQFVKPTMQHGSYPMNAHVENSMQPVIQSTPMHSQTMINMLSGRDAPPAMWNQGGNGGNNFQFGNYHQSGSYGKQAVDAMPCNGFNYSSNPFDKSFNFAINSSADASGMASLNSVGSADNLTSASKQLRQDSFCQENPFAGDWEAVNGKRSPMAMMGRQPSASQGFGSFNVGFAVVNHGANAQWN